MSLPPSKSPTPSPVSRCYEYAHDVDAGRIVACKKVKLACRRFLRDLERAKDPAYPWRFDEQKAARPVDFIERFLTPTKGDYDKMTLMPWQCFVECNLYGWVSKENGLRRFREGLIVVGTGNGKSTMLAGNATYGACKDGERGADIYLLANSKEQAGIVFNECYSQIKASRFLAPRFRTLRDGVYYDAMSASIRHRSSDSRRLDGLNPHMAIFDEIHEYRDFKLINIIKRKIVKRTQPLVIYITTMGNVIDGPLAYFYDLFTDAMSGKLAEDVADRMFAFIAELDEHDDPEDDSTWIKANPSLGVLLKIEDLRETWERDKHIPAQRADFLCKQLNITVNTDDMAFVQPEVLGRNDGTIEEDVYSWFCEQAKKYEIMTIGYDPANATRLRQMLENKGFACQIVRQGPLTLNDPMKDIKELLLGGRVVSNNDPMLRWYTDNVRISGERRHADKQNWMPSKRNKFRKIDGFMAWLDAHAINMEKNPAGEIRRAPAVRVVSLSSRRR